MIEVKGPNIFNGNWNMPEKTAEEFQEDGFFITGDLGQLDEAGYVNIVGLRGGYNMWNRTWDSKLRRRNLPGDFQEEYQHGADGCGVHATGASFQNQDAFQYADWKDDTEWITV